MCVCCIYGLYFQMKKLELKETELLPKVQKPEESRIRIRTLNLNFYHHGKGRVKHLFGCLLSIGRIYSHMIFWAVILKDSFLPGATLGLGHHLPHQSSYKAHLWGSGGMPSGFWDIQEHIPPQSFALCNFPKVRAGSKSIPYGDPSSGAYCPAPRGIQSQRN